MTSIQQFPAYTTEEGRARETFLALMWGLSYPGLVQTLPDKNDGLALIGEALLDLETSYFTPDVRLHERLKRTSARALSPEQAAYHFYPSLAGDGLAHIERASVGTLPFPDRAATLIIGCTFGSGTALTLEGPGIAHRRQLQIDAIPIETWTLRAQRCGYPLGWDMFLVDAGGALIGLPRTTKITLDS